MSTWQARPGRFRRVQNLLSYPGGKYRGAQLVMDRFPRKLKCMASPFTGGASIEIRMAQAGCRVFGYDIAPDLVHFWKQVLTVPFHVALALETILPDVPGGTPRSPTTPPGTRRRSASIGKGSRIRT